jgi:hypothetical protein
MTNLGTARNLPDKAETGQMKSAQKPHVRSLAKLGFVWLPNVSELQSLTATPAQVCGIKPQIAQNLEIGSVTEKQLA